jgi:hypothetical protein
VHPPAIVMKSKQSPPTWLAVSTFPAIRSPEPPYEVAPGVRDELALLLINLVRTSRYHTTQGTPLSSYLRCDRLIEQLLALLLINLLDRAEAAHGDHVGACPRITRSRALLLYRRRKVLTLPFSPV